MSSLYMKLPSFATDYSGFISLIHGLGGLMVVQDPSGCLGNYTNCDEPRWYHHPQRVFSSTFREMEAVIGDYSETIRKTCLEIQRKKPPFVCILGTPIPALTGCDVVSIADAVKDETGVPCYGITTNGFQFYQDGISRALALLYDEFMEQDVEKVEKTVNILGMTPLDYSIYGETEKLETVIHSFGWNVGAFLGMGSDLERVKRARSAQKNIVMCAAALPLAQAMEKEGIPYWIGPPCGKSGIQQLKGFLTGEPELVRSGCRDCRSVLIIGEQACANALRRMLEQEYGFSSVMVASFFGLSRELSRESDVSLNNESQLNELFHEHDFDLLIGDELFSAFCPAKTQMIPVPHPAVSSKLSWKEAMSFISEMPIRNSI